MLSTCFAGLTERDRVLYREGKRFQGNMPLFFFFGSICLSANHRPILFPTAAVRWRQFAWVNDGHTILLFLRNSARQMELETRTLEHVEPTKRAPGGLMWDMMHGSRIIDFTRTTNE